MNVPSGKSTVTLLQVVRLGPDDRDLPLACRSAALRRRLDLLAPGEVVARERPGVRRAARRSGPECTTSPPLTPAPGPMSTIQSAVRMVSSSCSTTIRVLPRSRRVDERLDEAAVVALVQADARLVEHVEHAREPRPDLGRQPDALRLAARERRGGTRQVQVVEADLEEEVEAQLGSHAAPARRSWPRGGELQLVHEVAGVGEAQLAIIRDARVRGRARRAPRA